MKTKDSAADLNRQLNAYAAVTRLTKRNPDSRWGKWPIYAAAAGAALAGASAASADIIYSGPVNLSGSSFQIFPDGKHGFGFTVVSAIRRHFVSSTTYLGAHHSSANLNRKFAEVGAVGLGTVAEGVFFTGTLAKNFAPGAPIGRGSGTNVSFSAQKKFLGTVGSVLTHQGKFLGSNGTRNAFPGPGFLGIDMGAQTSKGGVKPGSEEFGWIRVEFNPTFPGSIEVFDYAYNTNGPINAGEISQVPEPSPLPPMLLLATGAAGVLAWKRRRRQAPTA